MNLYGFINNNTLNFFDNLGLLIKKHTPKQRPNKYVSQEEFKEIFSDATDNDVGGTSNNWQDMATNGGRFFPVRVSANDKCALEVQDAELIVDVYVIDGYSGEKGIDGMTIEEHEYVHEEINSNFWNAMAEFLNSYDKQKMSSALCASQWADYLNNWFIAFGLKAHQTDLLFDVQQYQRKGLDETIRQIDQAVQELTDATKHLDEECR